MRAVTLQASSIDDLIIQIKNQNSEIFEPTLAFVFAPVSIDFKQLSNAIDNLGISLFGASYNKGIKDGAEVDDQIVVMLVNANDDAFMLHFEETANSNTFEISRNAAILARNKFINPAVVVVTSSLTTDGVAVVEGIQEGMQKMIPVFGGMASDLEMSETAIFTNNKVTTDGILFLIIDTDKIEVNGLASSGWETVGIEKVVTKAEGNIVYSIDNQPALDVFLKYYNIPDSDTPIGLTVGTKFPLQLQQKNKTPILRTPLIANKEDRSIIFAGKVPELSKVKFSIQPSFDIIERTVGEVESTLAQNYSADVLLMFSCVGRHVALGPMMEDEIMGIKKLWNVPMLGFFTYGEYGNSPGEKSDFHNETCSVMILKEK